MTEPNEILDDVWVMFWVEHQCSGKQKLHCIDHDTGCGKLQNSIRHREFTTSPTQVVIFKLEGEMIHSGSYDHIGREIGR